MDGCPLPVMSSNDSGDHGLTVNLPQFVYHQKMHTTKLAMFQAIALANLIT
jgi:L-cysteine desulfidase